MILTLDVDVLRFIAIASVEEQSIRTDPEYRRHVLFVSNSYVALF
jgi:hypothetical protein